MSYQTADDILAKWDSPELRKKEREHKQLVKDIDTAREAIEDALARYRKVKLKTRSKKKASEDPFSEIANYESRQQIHDDYGWGFITEARMDYLIGLWDAREESKSPDGVYRDRVTDMLEKAMNSVGDDYIEEVMEYQQQAAVRRRQAEQIARENNERSYRREHGLE